jgi:hypothetical protein
MPRRDSADPPLLNQHVVPQIRHALGTGSLIFAGRPATFD